MANLGMGRGGAASASGDGRAPVPDPVPFGSSVQPLALVQVHDAYQQFTGVDLTTLS